MAQTLSTNLGPVPANTPLFDSNQEPGREVPHKVWTRFFESIRTTVNRAPQYAAVTPANSGSAGSPGQFAYDTNFIYVCIAKNTWRRAAVAAF